MLSDTYARVPLDQIHIPRDTRQRRKVSTENLKDSISRRGVYTPIIIRPAADGEPGPYVLVAGERRLTASRELGLPDIPVRFAETLSITERQIIELEENVRREDLPWRDYVAALGVLHGLYQAEGKTNPQIADAIGWDRINLSKVLRVYRDINSPLIREASGWIPAYNLIARSDDRRANDALNDIIDTNEDIFNPAPVAPASAGASASIAAPPVDAPARPSPSAGTDDILHMDFIRWAPQYSGPRFNFIHCDFPYGIEVFHGKQSGRADGQYHDGEDVYWYLIRTLCQNLDRLMSPSAHLMFWFSMKYYTPTLEMFAKLAPSLNFNPFPLVWHKSDNSGILADPNRGPRNIYETAFMASREDRLIVQAVGNAYAGPIDRKYHPSTKPEPMLKHFFRMFVDENTALLDPTCGSGTAIRAAEELGAKRMLGLERDKQFYENACIATRNFRLLRKASRSMV